MNQFDYITRNTFQATEVEPIVEKVKHMLQNQAWGYFDVVIGQDEEGDDIMALVRVKDHGMNGQNNSSAYAYTLSLITNPSEGNFHLGANAEQYYVHDIDQLATIDGYTVEGLIKHIQTLN